MALKFSSFLAKAQEPSYLCWDGFCLVLLMNNEVHFSAGHYTIFCWLCQQKFSLCAARRGACSDYTEVQWWYIIIILPHYNNIIPKQQELVKVYYIIAGISRNSLELMHFLQMLRHWNLVSLTLRPQVTYSHWLKMRPQQDNATGFVEN